MFIQPQQMILVGCSKGDLVNGCVSVDFIGGAREEIEVVFAEPYEGPIDVIALAEVKGGDSDEA